MTKFFSERIGGNQERYVLAELFTDETYPIPAYHRFRGELDAPRLAAAIDTIVARHSILRTSYVRTASGVAAHETDAPPVLTYEELPADISEQDLMAHLRVEVYRKPGEMDSASMARFRLYQLGPNDAVLLFVLHHAIGDGVTMGNLAEEIELAYNAREMPVARDFYEVIAEEKSTDDEQAYWAAHLKDVPQPPSIAPDLNLTREDADTRPLKLFLDEENLDRLCDAWKVSRFGVVATLSQIVFGRLTGSDTMAVSFQSAGRHRFKDSGRTLGPFSNSVILTSELSPDAVLPDLALEQKALVRDALQNEAYPYQSVIRDNSVQPDFGINWFPRVVSINLEGIEPAPRQFVDIFNNYDVDFRFLTNTNGLELYIYYRSHLFSRARIEALAEMFTDALARAAKAPDIALQDLFPAPAPIAVPQAPPATGERLYDRFLDCAKAHPKRTALLGEGWSMSYGELEKASADLARRLVAKGLGPGSRIGILAERGPQLVWTQIAVLRVGATMVPLDAAYPSDRLRLLTQVSGMHAVILPDASMKRPDWLREDLKSIAARDPRATVPGSDQVSDDAIHAGEANNAAYILFTSGSTGTPKGVATSHAPALHFLEWQRRTFEIGPDDRFTNLNGVAHDMMIRDIFQPLSVGGELAIPQQDDIYRAGRLFEWVMAMKPTAMHLTPAMGNLLALARKPGQTLPLRWMFSGGDRMVPELCRALRDLAPTAQLINFYGATETPQAATFHVADLDAVWRSYPVGRGVDGIKAIIVDEDHQPVAPGVLGEIAIISPLPSLGYVIDGKIIPHETPGLYFTGDGGFEMPSGEIMLTGRQDDQISIRGYRIELGEIEHALTSRDDISEAKVLLDESGENPALVAFAVGEQGALPDPELLYADLARSLPHYLVPRDIVPLAAMPLLPNGKLDRAKLLAMPKPGLSIAEGREPRTGTERDLCEAWAEILSMDRVSPDHSFAELRGDSLNYVEVYLATEAVVGDLPREWETMDLAQIAALKVEGKRTSLVKWLETPIFVRATAIFLVVSLHLQVFSLGGGSTSALFMVSGLLIARLQLPRALEMGTVRHLLMLSLKVMIPVLLYVWSIAVVKLALGRPVAIESVLLLENFVDMTDRARMAAEGHLIPIWYTSTFLHMLLMLVGAVAITVKLFGTGVRPWHFALSMIGIGFVMRFGLPILFHDGFLANGLTKMSRAAHMPTTHFGIFALGMGIGMSETLRQRLICVALTALFVLGNYALLQTNVPYLIGVVGVLMIFISHLPIPRIAHRVVLMVSGASLFIYLTHEQFAKVLIAAGIPEQSLLLVGLSIACGVLLWMVWIRITVFLTSSDILPRRLQPSARSSAIYEQNS